MKKTLLLLFLLPLLLFAVIPAQAQQPESIWIESPSLAYKTKEVVVVSINAISAIPIQGFTFQIRYDPACLEPMNASSPIAGMNGLQLPQSTGLMDATFASTTPQNVSGVIAEASFTTLGACNTNLYLESAALAILNEEGFAAPLTNIAITQREVTLAVDGAIADTQEYIPVGTPLPLSMAETASAPNDNNFLFIFIALGGLGLSLIVGALVYAYLGKKNTETIQEG